MFDHLILRCVLDSIIFCVASIYSLSHNNFDKHGNFCHFCCLLCCHVNNCCQYIFVMVTVRVGTVFQHLFHTPGKFCISVRHCVSVLVLEMHMHSSTVLFPKKALIVVYVYDRYTSLFYFTAFITKCTCTFVHCHFSETTLTHCDTRMYAHSECTL